MSTDQCGYGAVMRETSVLRRRRSAGLFALLAGSVTVAAFLGMVATPAGAVQIAASKAHPSPSPSATPSPSPSPTSGGGGSCRFTVVSSPNVGVQDNSLDDVAVVSVDNVWAVGQYTTADFVVHTLVQHWNGSVWSVVPSPNRLTGTGHNEINALLGVAAVSVNDVWAVGYSASVVDPYQTLTMHWDGTSWSIVDSPNLTSPGAYNILNDVSTAAGNDVWAVGGKDRGILLHWDGSAWTMVNNPPGTELWQSSGRHGVVAVSGNDVWAVGDYDAWHFDGVSWTVPAHGAQFALDVDASGPGQVWAAGTVQYTISEGGPYGPYPIGSQWTGTAWQDHQSTRDLAYFTAITARAAGDIIGVGSSGASAYALRWDGTAWQPVTVGNGNPTPDPTRAFTNRLEDVATRSGVTWAIGEFYNAGGTTQTLTERYTC
jgi:hypothetical protein